MLAYKWAYKWLMAQITIYLDAELEADARGRAKAAGKSLSAYIADALRKPPHRLSAEFWDQIGTHPDFPLAEETRALDGPDIPRVPLD